MEKSVHFPRAGWGVGGWGGGDWGEEKTTRGKLLSGGSNQNAVANSMGSDLTISSRSILH